MEIVQPEEEKDLRREEITEIVRKEDLTPFFQQSDHSVNKVYFSQVNEDHFDDSSIIKDVFFWRKLYIYIYRSFNKFITLI